MTAPIHPSPRCIAHAVETAWETLQSRMALTDDETTLACDVLINHATGHRRAVAVAIRENIRDRQQPPTGNQNEDRSLH